LAPVCGLARSFGGVSRDASARSGRAGAGTAGLLSLERDAIRDERNRFGGALSARSGLAARSELLSRVSCCHGFGGVGVGDRGSWRRGRGCPAIPAKRADDRLLHFLGGGGDRSRVEHRRRRAERLRRAVSLFAVGGFCHRRGYRLGLAQAPARELGLAG